MTSGRCRAADSAGQARRRQASGQHARGGQRGDVRPEHRLPVAVSSERPAAAQHGPRLSSICGVGRHAAIASITRSTSSAASKAEREASPTACIIDSQSVKSAEKGGPRIDPHGFDAGKLIKGKKRHVLVDTRGLAAARHRHLPPMFRIAMAALFVGDALWPVSLS